MILSSAKNVGFSSRRWLYRMSIFSYFELFMSVLVSFTFYTETGIDGDVISRYPVACILCSLNISV